MERFHVGEESPVQLFVPGARSKSIGAFAAVVLGLAAAGIMLLIVVPAGASPAVGASSAQSVQDDLSKFGALAPVDTVSPGTRDGLAPDVTLLVDRPGSSIEPGGDASEVDPADNDLWWIAVREALLEHPAVASVAIDFPSRGATAFHIGLDVSARRSSVADVTAGLADLVAAEAADGATGASVQVGGRALTDEAITDRFGTSVRWLAVLALSAAGWVGFRLGPRRGLAMALAWGGSVLLAGRITDAAVGPFDGTAATSPLVGASSGLLFALVVGLRVAKWHEDPAAEDGADAIRRSLSEVLSDVVLVLGSFLAVVGVLWISGGSSRAIVAVVVGGLVGATFTAAITGPVFAALGSDGRPVPPVVPYTVPSGGHLLVLTVLGLVGLLALLSVFAFRAPGRDAIDYRSLPTDDPTRVVGDILGAGPGDPTEAIISVVEASSPEATETWGSAVATLANVAWVDTADIRFTGVDARAVGPEMSLASAEQVGFSSDELAVIVPAVPIRSSEGAALLDEIERLSDDRVEILSAGGAIGLGSTVLVVSTIVLLALAGAGAIHIETDNSGQALTSFLLRLLGGGATVGLYRLVSVDATATEAMAALGLVAAAVSLFELEFLHDRVRLVERWSTPNGLIDVDDGQINGIGEPSDGVDGIQGRGALLGAGGLLVAGFWISFTRFLGGGPTVGRFGFALGVALIIEIALGFLVLRPVLLGERAAYHTVARPLRSTLHSGTRRQRSQPISVDDPAWRRVVSDLLLAEFGLQTDPASSRVEDVFLEGTPLYRQASEQHRNLFATGLRVSGRPPQIERIETFREGPSVMVSVTVDHPDRNLVDVEGTVYGVRQAQRRSTMLWMVGLDEGAVRIAESVDTDPTAVDADRPPDEPSSVEVATIGGRVG